MLADHASPEGDNVFASVKTIAERARMSERATQYALRCLEQSGSIRVTGRHKSGTRIYEIPGVQILHRVQDHAKNVSDFAPEPKDEQKTFRVQELHRCTKCGLEVKTKALLDDHLRNVEGEDVPLSEEAA